MAGQDIEPGPREPTWHIKQREGSEFLFKKCRECGQLLTEPSYAVIRTNDEQFGEWYQIGKEGEEYGIGFILAFPAAIAVFLLVIFGGGKLLEPFGQKWAFVVLSVLAFFLAVLTFLVSNHRMHSYNRKVRENRRQRKAEFLKQFGGMDPDEVGIPDSPGRKKYVLVPAGIYDQLSYEKYLE